MITTHRRMSYWLSVLLVFALCTVCLQFNLYAATGPESALVAGRLESPTAEVTINGANAATGARVSSGARVVTAECAASVDLGVLGSVNVGAGSSLLLDFTNATVAIVLDKGSVMLTTNQGIAGSVKTPDGNAQLTDPSKISTVVVHAHTAAAPVARRAFDKNQALARMSQLRFHPLTDTAAEKSVLKSPSPGQGASQAKSSDETDKGARGARLMGIFIVAGAATAAIIFFERGRRGRPCGPQDPKVFLPCPVD